MPPVTIYWQHSARPDDPEAYHVPGMEDEKILPRENNLSDAPAGRGGPYGPGVPHPRTPPRTGILTGNGAVFIGSKGIMATCDRGEGVHLLPAARWADYVLPPQVLTRSPGHMADWIRACKGGNPSCSDFSVSAPFAEWMALGVVALRVPGKLEWDSKNLRFTNSAEANNYVQPVLRKGWEMKL